MASQLGKIYAELLISIVRLWVAKGHYILTYINEQTTSVTCYWSSQDPAYELKTKSCV